MHLPLVIARIGITEAKNEDDDVPQPRYLEGSPSPPPSMGSGGMSGSPTSPISGGTLSDNGSPLADNDCGEQNDHGIGARPHRVRRCTKRLRSHALGHEGGGRDSGFYPCIPSPR